MIPQSIRWQLLLGLAALLVFAGTVQAGDIEGVINVAKPDQAVIYVDVVPGNFAGKPAVLDQQNKVFTPYVLPVVKGTTVEFRNSDSLTHNVFGVGADEFNLGNWTKGIAREHTFNKLGEVTILCNVHPEMEAYILVLQNPFFVQPDGSGKFHIGHVPAGSYVVKAWYRGKTKKANVSVAASGSATVNF